MDARFINPFIIATRHVFKTSLSTDVMIGRPFIKLPNEPNSDVSAIIGVAGDAIGCVVLSLPVATAKRMACKFASENLDAEDPGFADALGELANMVAGQARAHLQGLHTTITLPSVVRGRGREIKLLKVAPRLALPCDSSMGRFVVEVSLRIRKPVVEEADEEDGASAPAQAPPAAVAGASQPQMAASA